MTPKQTYYENTANTILKNLEKRQIEGYYCPTSKDAIAKASSFLKSGDSASFGGSMTLEESGIMSMLENREDIILLDRMKATTPEEQREIYQKIFSSDYYFMSTNALTMEGELVNIDGNGNRVASLIFGPKNVIVVAGMNKVVKDVKTAYSRVKNIASPMNCNRLQKKTPCAITGQCGDCYSPDCICSHTVVTRRSGTPGRIKLILVGEELGY
jgi:L-lactate utilization protein LutB